MDEPLWWRALRTAALLTAFGFAVLALLAISEALAGGTPEGTPLTLGKPEPIAWMFALLAAPLVLLTPLPNWGWGFVRAFSVPALTWYLLDLAAGVSDSLHHADPLWLEWVGLAFVYVGAVPWASWAGARRRIAAPARPVSS